MNLNRETIIITYEETCLFWKGIRSKENLMNTSKLLTFEKLHNIRDLGGMAAADGRRIVVSRIEVVRF